jgi:hypothetical protein
VARLNDGLVEPVLKATLAFARGERLVGRRVGHDFE